MQETRSYAVFCLLSGWPMKNRILLVCRQVSFETVFSLVKSQKPLKTKLFSHYSNVYMNNNAHPLHAGMLHDQTYLVDTLLKEESEMKNACQWYNHMVFTVTLAESTFTGNLSELDNHITGLKAQVSSMERQMQDDPTLADTTLYRMELKRLHSDIDLLLKADGKRVEVYQWLLVSYWLSEKLLNAGEVILRVYGNNWWGITSLGNQDWIITNIMKEMVNE